MVVEEGKYCIYLFFSLFKQQLIHRKELQNNCHNSLDSQKSNDHRKEDARICEPQFYAHTTHMHKPNYMHTTHTTNHILTTYTTHTLSLSCFDLFLSDHSCNPGRPTPMLMMMEHFGGKVSSSSSPYMVCDTYSLTLRKETSID